MTLGDYLKQQRTEQDFSQAELAEKMGVEQSYLSKLEAERSIPSAEILAAWLSALQLELDDVLDQLDRAYLHAKLSRIPSIDAWLRQQKVQSLVRERIRLYAAVLCIALAVPMFYLGYTKLLFNESIYEYQSPGVVLPGESQDIYHLAPQLSDGTLEERHQSHLDILKRRNPKILLLSEYRGEQFNRPIPEAASDLFTRTYYLEETHQRPRWQNTLLQALGLFLGTFGLVLLLILLRTQKR
ncbi:helix-turn-helix domain-containing protein [Pseudidiomarina sp. E22-M8]|uniref:helix-turn-helix domain-containing protein n=1 Tax=Pseudidiomarina sp. E22-M8 TaxID=3424768 RepID=UPI00403CD0B1